MKKYEYRQLIAGKLPKSKKKISVTIPSQTDPRYAQSGRDILFNPIPYEMKQIYQNGVPLSQMQPFDRMYLDKLDAFQMAKEYDQQQNDKVQKFQKEQETKQQNQDENTKPTN